LAGLMVAGSADRTVARLADHLADHLVVRSEQLMAGLSVESWAGVKVAPSAEYSAVVLVVSSAAS
jgi:hypothetical protein